MIYFNMEVLTPKIILGLIGEASLFSIYFPMVLCHFGDASGQYFMAF